MVDLSQLQSEKNPAFFENINGPQLPGTLPEMRRRFYREYCRRVLCRAGGDLTQRREPEP